MKKIVLQIFLAISLFACKNDDDGCIGVDCLTPATQTGEGTFGCLINGEPFVDNSGRFNCFYQVLDEEYYFGIQAQGNNAVINTIAIGSLQKEIILNSKLSLNSRKDREFYAIVDFNTLRPAGSTNDSEDGFISFNKLDHTRNIVSATFEFDFTDPSTGKKYEITEGRFDAKFTE